VYFINFFYCIRASVFLAFLAVADLGQSQTLSNTSDLKAEPATEAKTVKVLAKNAPAKMLKRQGFWAEIESGGSKGWVKLSELNLAAAGVAGFSAMESGRTGKGNIVSTSAARGLSAKELIAAKPDPLQFEQLKSLTVSSADAENFAQSAGLKTRSVALLAAPARPPSSAAASGSTDAVRRKSSKKEDDDDDEDD